MYRYYDYKEIREAAIAHMNDDLAAETAEELYNWFSANDTDSWNGEWYDADGYRLYPIDRQVGEDEYEIIGWELRYD